MPSVRHAEVISAVSIFNIIEVSQNVANLESMLLDDLPVCFEHVQGLLLSILHLGYLVTNMVEFFLQHLHISLVRGFQTLEVNFHFHPRGIGFNVCLPLPILIGYRVCDGEGEDLVLGEEVQDGDRDFPG